MLSGNFQTVTASTLSAVAGFAIFGAISTNSAQAAVLTYTSKLTVSATGNPDPIASGFFTYTTTFDEPSVPSNQVGYELNDFAFGAPLVGNVTLADIRTSPFLSSYALELSALIPGVYPEYLKYQDVLPRILKGDPTEFDYVGDGGFPPNDFSYAFPPFQPDNISYPFSPLVAYFADLFPEGGQVDFTTQLGAGNLASVALSDNDTANTAATPEPTTLAGLGLAGLGLAIARRRKQ